MLKKYIARESDAEVDVVPTSIKDATIVVVAGSYIDIDDTVVYNDSWEEHLGN